jgi:hypothetical protein
LRITELQKKENNQMKEFLTPPSTKRGLSLCDFHSSVIARAG